jgi:tetratricopeptide (TPR) repeat protein
MKRTLLLILTLLYFVSATKAQEEARAAWQVTKFEVNGSISSVKSASTIGTLSVTTTINARNVGQGSGQRFTVRLNPKAEIKAARVGSTAAEFTTRPEPKTDLQLVTITLPSTVEPNGSVIITIEHSLPLTENSKVASISPLGSLFLPLSFWYPAPNTYYSIRGADVAPLQITVNAGSGEKLISTGKASGSTYIQPLHAQPFFLTGRWETVEGSGDATGISAELFQGATVEERKQAEALIRLAASAKAFFNNLFGIQPDVPIRLVAVTKGAGFSGTGTLLLDSSVFRRTTIDSSTALLISEALARLWIGGMVPVRGEGGDVIREGLVRYLAMLFLEAQYGKEGVAAEWIRKRVAYSAISKRDGPLATSTAQFDTHFNAVSNKGALVWRLIGHMLGRDAFIEVVRAQLQAGRNSDLTLSTLRKALVERGGENLKAVLDYQLDNTTEMDLMIGLPQSRGTEWVSALRNTGAINSTVTIQATTETGERISTEVTIPAKDFGEAHFKTTKRITRVEIDPDKLYPQLDYSNDLAPKTISYEEALAEAGRLFSKGEYTNVEKYARDILNISPNQQEMQILLARALLGQNKFDDAEREFRKALDAKLPLPSTLAWSNIGLAEIALQRAQHADALKRFDEAARVEADYAATLTARRGRIRAASALKSGSAIDESVRTFIGQLDQSIRGGRKAEIETLIAPGELLSFVKGIVASQPETWQTKVLYVENLGADKAAVDVELNLKQLDREQSGTAVYYLARIGGNWKLSAVEFFEVK